MRLLPVGSSARPGCRRRPPDRRRAVAPRRRPRRLAPRVEGARPRVIRAAGGIVTREGRVLLVHRPRYDDWTFPKGKAEDGESDEDCALREVREETGLDCELLDELSSTAYIDSRGRPKRVRWWRMRPIGGAVTPTDEGVEIR